MAERAVLAPFLGQLHGGFLQIARVFLEFAFKALEQRNGVGSRAREARDDLIVVQAPGLARRVLHDMIAHGHLAIGDEHDFVVFAHA